MRSTAELAGLTMSPSAVSHAVNQIHAGEFGEGDSATSIDYGDESIRGLPVKSLANLASYPNPHQELARNALEKSSFAMEASHQPWPNTHGDVSDGNGPILFPNQPQETGTSLHNKANVQALAHYASGVAVDASIMKHHGTSQYGGYSGGRQPITPGVPEPLTAGPPRQRRGFHTPSAAAHMATDFRYQNGQAVGIQSSKGEYQTPCFNSYGLRHTSLAHRHSTANQSSSPITEQGKGRKKEDFTFDFVGRPKDYNFGDTPGKVGQQAPFQQLRPQLETYNIQGTDFQHASGSGSEDPRQEMGASNPHTSNLIAPKLDTEFKSLEGDTGQRRIWGGKAQNLGSQGWNAAARRLTEYPHGAIRMTDEQLVERQKGVDKSFYSGTARLELESASMQVAELHVRCDEEKEEEKAEYEKLGSAILLINSQPMTD
ncbi:unnamed protein product [Parascedosporium putredinis]|uniref:Uncharacterized protein n=1 Tax=Parascedosporium putredinis TaxID=1442378 RepID=A0A9P1M620_9PEZI|nr:unnamed protein product [Parascedosporium putredinis]CAI7987910.1 unnamed protein product [Parascedosporium putredinis]